MLKEKTMITHILQVFKGNILAPCLQKNKFFFYVKDQNKLARTKADPVESILRFFDFR